MNRATLMVCKTFLSQMPAEKQRLVELLPKSEQEIFFNLPSPSQMNMSERLKVDLLNEIHSSWLSPYLRTLAENDLRLFLAALLAEQKKELETQLGFQNDLPTLTKIAKKTLRQILLNHIIQNQELIPLGFLPEHPLNRLLGLTHAKLKTLVTFLGLHDLSFEMRQIIATAVLKKIFAALTKKEGEYLQSLVLHKEPLVFERLFLKKWDGSSEHLSKILQERGAHRLAHALYSCEQSLIWYVTHRLEMHTGNLVLKHKEKPVHARAETLLLGQIEKILKTLTTKEAA